MLPLLWDEERDPSGRGVWVSLLAFQIWRLIWFPQLVTLPYNLVLQKSAREALGIDLTGQILVIDEAHSPSS